MYSCIHHRFEVSALTPEDTAEYLRMRLTRAGYHREVFASDAIVVLHEATVGAMRDLDRLAAHALRETARKKRKLVERDVVTRVVDADTRERDGDSFLRCRVRDRHLAGLASLEVVVVFAARALVNSFPAVSKVERPGESPEVATARDLVDQCDYFLSALDAHWHPIAAQLPDQGPHKARRRSRYRLLMVALASCSGSRNVTSSPSGGPSTIAIIQAASNPIIGCLVTLGSMRRCRQMVFCEESCCA